ncbi:hypothetical protein L1987_04462 [Smallanthus sonchifolius]|uniref:Uncharacterized protein n=1 Tax=Smallanthus sonchifolius TaxID=185202 RepID=A0ACB9JSU3_9ASTR|nr:hypothetical protein L1987_04462 [Smallanthus sonchifolius]
MIPSIPVPNLQAKPPDPFLSQPIDPKGGHRSSSRLAISAKSHKGKDGSGSGRSNQGLIKLNFGDFVAGNEKQGENDAGRISDNSEEGLHVNDLGDVGLMYTANGVVIATSHMEEESRSAAVITPTSVVSPNRFAALDSDMAAVPCSPNSGSSDDQEKFYEFSEETIANVLNCDPSSLTIPRVNDMDLDLGENLVQDDVSEDEIPDFDITNAQKKAISNSLEKVGAVKAGDQANWSQVEWEYFHYLLKVKKIDPSTSIEDVDSDSNGTALFFKSQLKKGMMGVQEKIAPLPTKIV